MGKKRNIKETVREAKPTSVLRDVFRDFIGESALTVLEYQLSKRLTGTEPFELLLTDPATFYDALASILGSDAASTLLKLIFKQVASKHGLTWLNVDELITLLTADENGAKERISKLVQEIYEAEYKKRF